MTRRLLSDASRQRVLRGRLAHAGATTGADIFIPLSEQVLEAATIAAERTGGMVQRSPGMPNPGPRDLVTFAPGQPELALPVAGVGPGHTPAHSEEPYRPEPGRLEGRHAVLCFRKTQSNPGRYIEDAMRRSGLDVRVETDAIDLGSVDPEAAFVLFVEGPYPAIEVTGATKVPVLFWAHHGEHHLQANLRLTDRYQADAVLLAHSWHLAPWFPTAVHRFPFAVSDECDPTLNLVDRPFEVSMVGSKLRGDAWQYATRQEMVATVESELGRDHTRFVEGIAPSEMFELYGKTKIVLNEGGTRHYPITMRVFEAIGSRALLMTDPAPGLEVLFDPDTFAMLGPDLLADVGRFLTRLDTSQSMADRAYEHALGHHTYDHRVDELVEIAATTIKRDVSRHPIDTELARLIDHDVEVQRLVHSDGEDLAEDLPTRETWPISEREGRTAKASMDAAVITQGSALEAATMLDMARLLIYASNRVTGLDEYLTERRPGAIVSDRGSYVRVDLMAESYRIDTPRRGA